MLEAAVRQAWQSAALTAAGLSLAACSMTWRDEDGTRHVVGLVAMEIQEPPSELFAGEFVDTQTLGVAVYALPAHQGLSVGWSREVLGSLKNNVLVSSGPIAVPRRRPLEEQPRGRER